MDLNWFVAEYLIRQQRMEMEQSARQAWKWHKTKQRWWLVLLSLKQPLTAKTNACCTSCC